MKVGILSPGDMGAAVGGVLSKSGIDVLTSLEGRGELSRQRARENSIRDVGSYYDLAAQADLIISILVPSEALGVADRIAACVLDSGKKLGFADCNAVAPATVRKMAAALNAAGVNFIDGGIIGGPPQSADSSTRFYCSGPDTSIFESLAASGLKVRVVGAEVGQASGLKMLYAASTKGTTAVWTELLVAARALGLSDALNQEIEGGRGADIMRGIPSMPRRSRRWVGEMEEIAATFAAVGLTPRIFEGAAAMYEFVGESRFGDLTERDPNPPLEEILDELARRLPLE